MTPTNSCLGRLDPATLSKVDERGQLDLRRQADQGIFLASVDVRGAADRGRHRPSAFDSFGGRVGARGSRSGDPIPPITAYYVMRIGRLALVPYYAPGDLALANAVREVAGRHHAVLLANHGPVVAGKDLETAVYATEELEETAKLYLLLRGEKTRLLSAEQVRELQQKYPS